MRKFLEDHFEATVLATMMLYSVGIAAIMTFIVVGIPALVEWFIVYGG